MCTDNEKKYDVFISYRRKTGVNDARLLEQALKARNFKVFFDYNSIRDGHFDERIYTAIEEAPIFLLVLSSGALDSCVREGDWVRIELEHALKHGKKIIPVKPSDQECSFPDNLPDFLQQLKFEQFSGIDKGALFEASIDKIIHDRFPADMRPVESGSESVFVKLIDDTYSAIVEFRNVVKHALQEEIVEKTEKMSRCFENMFLFYEKNMFSNSKLADDAKQICEKYNVFVGLYNKFFSYPGEKRMSEEAQEYAFKAENAMRDLVSFMFSAKNSVK